MVGSREVEVHQFEQRSHEALGLPEGQVEDEPQGECGLDRHVGVQGLPASLATSVRRPGGGGRLGEPDGDVATIPEALLVFAPVLNAILRLVGRVNVPGLVGGH